jgi:hypothetical protein
MADRSRRRAVDLVAYIPTRGSGRIPNATKLAKSILAAEPKMLVYIVSETLVKIPGTETLRLKRAGVSRIGEIRALILEHAASSGYRTAFMCDDDQTVTGDLAGMLWQATRRDVVGIAAWKSIYGLWYGGTAMAGSMKLPPEHRIGELWLNRGNAHQATAFNVVNAISVGNFDKTLRACEDGELARRAVSLGFPWMMYTGVTASGQASAAVVRATSQGGISDGDQPYYDRLIAESQAACAERWPGYVSEPPRKYRCNWRALSRDFLPSVEWPVENRATSKSFDWR